MMKNNMKNSKVMTIGDLRKAIVGLPDDMKVFLPFYANSKDETDIFPVDYLYTNLAGVVRDSICGDVFTFGMLTETSNLTMKDTLIKNNNVSLVQELFPERGAKQLITLRDYVNAGVLFNAMSNGFNLYDYNREDENGEAKCLTCIYKYLIDCPVINICSDWRDGLVCAIYIDASKFNDKYIDALLTEATEKMKKE